MLSSWFNKLVGDFRNSFNLRVSIFAYLVVYLGTRKIYELLKEDGVWLSEIVCYHTTTISLADHYHNLAVSDSMIAKGKIVVKLHHNIGANSMMLASIVWLFTNDSTHLI